MAQPAPDNFAITDIQSGIVTVTYTFADLPTTPQKLAGLPLDDEAAVTEAVAAYGRAYKAGLEREQEAVTPSSAVEALQNQPTPLEGS